MSAKILKYAGFSDLNDLLGTFAPLKNQVLGTSLTLGGFAAFIESFSGISFMLWVFLAASSIVDLFFGLIVNVFFLKQEYESSKFFRGVFKAGMMFIMIYLTNTFRVGIEESVIKPEYMKATSIYITNTIHYAAVLIIGLYILLGIAENGAKLKIPVFVSLVFFLRIKIKNIENKENKSTTR